MADSFQVVSSGLFVSNVSVNTCISRCACQVLTLSEWDVLTVRVLVALGETEINDEDVIFVCVIAANQEVIRLDISMNYTFFMHFLDALNLYYIDGYWIWISLLPFGWRCRVRS